MNLITMKSRNWVVAMAMLALPGAMLTSCSKDTQTEQVAPKGDKLTVSVKGIKNAATGNALKQSAGKATAETTSYKVQEFSDVDMAVSVDHTLPVKATAVYGKAGAGHALRAAEGEEMEVMAEGNKYVLYIYDGETLVSTTELDAGIAGTVEGLDLSKEYTWAALSYNSTTAPVASDGVADLPLNTDVLYAKGTVDMATDPTINVTFAHKLARIGVELNTIGVFGEIANNPAVSISGLSIASGSLDVLTGTLTAGDPEAATLTYADFENVDPNFDDAKIAYFYTAPTAEQSVELTVQGLDVTLVDGGDTRSYFAQAATFAPATVTPEEGTSYHLAFNAVESALTTNYDGREVKWGRSNLFYRNTGDALRNYAFYATNGQSARADGYFGFGGTVPGTFATAATEGDPCALVYPAGLWKQPANEDFDAMVNSSGTLTNVLGSLLGAVIQLPGAPNATLGDNYIQYSATSPGGAEVFGDEGNNLRFYFNGHINEVAALTQLGNGGGLLGLGLNDLSVSLLDQSVLDLGINVLDSYGDLTALWTHDQALDLLGLAGAGTWGYIAIPVNPLIGSEYVPARKTAELLNGVNALGIDVLSTTLKNVRCVRAN